MALDFNYKLSDFPEDTQSFLKTVINIYMMLDNRKLPVGDKTSVPSVCYYNRIDKKCLAIFLTGFINYSEVEDIFKIDSDISIDKVLKFSKLTIEDIYEKMDEDRLNYGELYNTYLKSYINSIFSKLLERYNVNEPSSEVLLFAISDPKIANSSIIADLVNKYSESPYGLKGPIFEGIKFHVMFTCKLSEKLKNSIMQKNELSVQLEMDAIKDINTSLEIDPKIYDYVEVLNKKFVGQEEFAEAMFYNIVNNIALAKSNKIETFGRSIMFVDGASGTGKTAIPNDIAKKLNVPYVCSSVSNYSAAGYKGGDLTDLLEQLYEQANNNLELAQRGVLILDEFDKIASGDDGKDLVMKDAVQSQLLSLLGGEKMTFSTGPAVFGGKTVKFDTSKLTIICLGAITELRKEKTTLKQPMGFGSVTPDKKVEYTIKPEDLINMDIQKELVGRINTFLHTRDYSLEDLEKILRTATISPMLGLEEMVKAYGKTLTISDSVYPLIASKAYELDTGARSLQTVINSIRTILLKEVLRGQDKEIKLTNEVVEMAYSKTVNRTLRG